MSVTVQMRGTMAQVAITMRCRTLRRRAFSASLLAGIAGVTACDSPLASPACTQPEITSSSITSRPNNVLSAMITIRARSADSVGVRFGITGHSIDGVTPVVLGSTDSVLVPLLGLQEVTTYDVQAVASNKCGTITGPALTFTTDALPPDLPRYVAAGVDPSPGYVAFAAGSFGIVIDNTGRIVWYHRFPNGPGLNFQPQPNGRYTARPNTTSAGEIGKWIEIDPLGNVTRTLGCAGGLQARLHDFIAEGNGSYWLMCDRVQTMDLSSTGGPSQAAVMGTGVQHISATGEVLFDWSPFDHLEVDLRAIEPADQAVTPINWTHGNAIDLDTDGNLLISFRNLSQIIKIDIHTGAVVWRMGGAANQFTFQGVTVPAFARQHGLRSTGVGSIQLLDNLGDPRGSRAERYQYDEAAHTVRLISSIASSSGAIALTGGTTQSLPGGRVLVSFGNGGSVEESDAAGNIVWKIQGNPGYVFRAERIRSLYSPGVNDPR